MHLAGLIHLLFKLILAIGLITVFGHNAFDNIRFPENSWADLFWSMAHVNNQVVFGGDYIIGIHYPLIPWIGVMALGYCLGSLFVPGVSAAKRKKILFATGGAALALFIALRTINIYGDPYPWEHQQNTLFTFLSFFKVNKYPPSLLYLCITLGIGLVVLAWMETKSLKYLKPVIVFGKVPLFYYVIHLYLIHSIAMVAALLTGHPWHSMIITGWINDDAALLKDSYGFNLGIVYLIWIGVILILYPLCVWFNNVKAGNKGKWWVSYV